MDELRESYLDRRRSKRVNTDFPVHLKQMPGESGTIHNSLSIDMSEQGLQLTSFYFYPVNSQLLVEVMPAPRQEIMKMSARVVWVTQLPYQERYKLGVEFSDINPEQQLELRQIVNSEPGC